MPEAPGEAQSANADVRPWQKIREHFGDELAEAAYMEAHAQGMQDAALPAPAVPVGDETEALHKARLDALLGEGVPFDYADAQAWEELAREALAHVAGLEFELRLARAKIRLREESQIPVVPRGAQAKIERLEEREAALRDALRAHLADPALDGWTRAHLEDCLRARGVALPADSGGAT